MNVIEIRELTSQYIKTHYNTKTLRYNNKRLLLQPTPQVAITNNVPPLINQQQFIDIDIGVAKSDEYWAIADLHCKAFYPNSSGLYSGLMELERVISLQEGERINKMGKNKFACLVARVQDKRGWASGQGSLGEDLMWMGVNGFLRAFLPLLGATGFGFDYKGLGVCGAVVVDDMGMHLPKKKIRKNGKLVGYEERKNVGYISNLASAPDMRRKGIARSLLRKAENLCERWGCGYVALHVESHNLAALQLYKYEGYRVVQQSQNSATTFPRAQLTLMVKRIGKMNATIQSQNQITQKSWFQ
eukprot:TRINITY_DN4955_c0_g1_i1.p1 TRINITY_DN4955_c0_g1~~TRINITY_DN4955_c0_g1_i1.p1  ORF type:complete len:313 (-),score=44.39 TRINITY_DN4955_c0_g1_i1:1617-2519(-)